MRGNPSYKATFSYKISISTRKPQILLTLSVTKLLLKCIFGVFNTSHIWGVLIPLTNKMYYGTMRDYPTICLDTN
jgi:hypothetical protein